jgi:tRNA(adenine34) deaminase
VSLQPATDPAAASPDASDERFMRLALEQARLAADAGEVPVGAVVVLPPEALAAARLTASHPWSSATSCVVAGSGGNRTRRDGLVHAHAELVALAQAEQALGDFRLEQAVVYVTLEPCLMCLGALHQARVARLVYGASEPKFGALGSRFDLRGHEALRRISFTSGVLADEASELMASFFRRLRGAGGPQAELS